MNEWQADRDREKQLRRSTSAQRGLVAIGTVGALGAAVAIGVSQASRSTGGSADQQNGTTSQQAQTQQPGERDDDGGSSDDDGGFSDDEGRQPRFQDNQSQQSGGQLAVPGNGGPAQGQSHGS